MPQVAAFIYPLGEKCGLETLGGSHSEGFDIADLGQAVGWAQSDSGGKSYQAFVWNGQMTDLGVLGGFESSRAEAINNHGVVVGVGSAGQTGGAFVYDPHLGLRFLQDLIPSGSGWSQLSPRDINNAGWIVGSATDTAGFRHAFLMTPATVIPTVSEYGIVVLTLLILTCGTLVLRRRTLRFTHSPFRSRLAF